MTQEQSLLHAHHTLSGERFH